MEMNPEVKAKWVSALRSGTWLQGRNKLKTVNDEYCCLGVLCELALLEGKTDYWEEEKPYVVDLLYGNYNNRGIDPDQFAASWSSLPTNVKAWAEIDHSDPLVKISSDHRYYETVKNFVDGEEYILVSVLNDNGVPFDVIADLIEEQF